MTFEISNLLEEIREEAAEADAQNRKQASRIAEREKTARKHRTPDQIAAHRDLYRQARRHVEEIDAWNAANPDKSARPYLPPMLAYIGAFSYVEKDT